MLDSTPMPASEVVAGRKRRPEGMKLAEIENNPLTVEDVAMFDMFHREAWCGRAQTRLHSNQGDDPGQVTGDDP